MKVEWNQHSIEQTIKILSTLLEKINCSPEIAYYEKIPIEFKIKLKNGDVLEKPISRILIKTNKDNSDRETIIRNAVINCLQKNNRADLAEKI